MRTLKAASLILAALLLAGFAYPKPAEAGVSLGFFVGNLSPHGSWYVSASLGRVWQPGVYRAGWNPYYDGHWEYTEAGWAWDSDYDWGYVPYHYGTWANDPNYGWVWVPGYTWAPSWVNWRTGPGYIGWAPVAPSFSIGVSFNFGHHDDDHYVFLGEHDFLCSHVGHYAVPAWRANEIAHNTRVINNNYNVVDGIVHNNGPDRMAVERATGHRLTPVRLDQVRGVRELGNAGIGRDAIRVGPRVGTRGIRAAEPVSPSTPLPKVAAAPGRGREARQASIGSARGPESIFRSLDNGRSAGRASASSRPSSSAPEARPSRGGFDRTGMMQNNNADRTALPGTLTRPTAPSASRGAAWNGPVSRGSFPESTSARRPFQGNNRHESPRAAAPQARAPRGGRMSGPAFGGREFRAPAARGGASHASRPAQSERHGQGRTAEPRKHSR